MANGKVVTGFSKPVVANYSAENGVVTYSNCQPLARGVEVSIEPENGSASTFYADNTSAESVAGQFNGGTLTYTVDGLLRAAERMINGLPEAGADGWLDYDNRAVAPYLGTGFLMRTMSGGVTKYTPVVLTKVQFEPAGTEAATQEEEIDWQTSELAATILRDDTVNQCWKSIGDEYATEALAYAALVTKLGGTSPA